MPPRLQRARKQPTRQPAEVMRFGAAPNKIDRLRYKAFKSGMTVKEIAEQEGVQEKTIDFSLQRVRAENAGYSSEETTMQVRKILLQHLPKAFKVLDEAMDATKLESRQVVALNSLTGDAVQLQESVRVADHDTRLKAHGELRGILSVVQPREPLISIDSRSQTNIMQSATPVTTNSLTSPEAVIRAIRQQRGLALADGVSVAGAVIDAVVEEEAAGGEDDEVEDDELVDEEDDDGS